jgi:lathosterol oxidase
MLCEIMNNSSLGFVETWTVLTIAAWISLVLTSGIPFWYYYMNPTYEKWIVKTNRNYPPPSLVRSEAYKSLKGCIFVTLSPTLALYLAKIGMHSNAYCGIQYGIGYEVIQFVLVFFITDFFEWGWHWLGHRFDVLWEIHRPHHKYFNPTPWAVIADDAPDEIIRGSPLFLIPMLFPTNLEMLFLQFILFFNFYGTLIHTGIDYKWLSPHGTKFLNTPYHHHIHHRLSTKNKPLHTGFFLQIWDRYLGNSIYTGDKCYCSECDAKEGNRTVEAFQKLHKPDYSVLLQPSYWLGDWVEETKDE